MTILIDSSVLIDALARRVDLHRDLALRIHRREWRICGVIRAEVLRGVPNPKQRDRVRDLFDLAEDIPTTPEVWDRAMGLAWSLDRQGRVLPLIDVVIAACALEAAALLVTTDPHFDHVPGLRTSRTLPTVP